MTDGALTRSISSQIMTIYTGSSFKNCGLGHYVCLCVCARGGLRVGRERGRDINHTNVPENIDLTLPALSYIRKGIDNK